MPLNLGPFKSPALSNSSQVYSNLWFLVSETTVTGNPTPCVVEAPGGVAFLPEQLLLVLPDPRASHGESSGHNAPLGTRHPPPLLGQKRLD